MKLKSLHIYGYGKLIDFHIENISNLQVFFGQNEAGKSTLMSFIHSILFGFPGKQQTALRYEPKTHSAFGGQIIAHFDSYGEVKIERIKGRSAGNVTVILEDGSSGGEELLGRILDGMDRLMYESIFSFNLQGLQEIDRLKGDDIGRYLVAAGTVGTDLLLNAEQQLQKELDNLFKPNGRKPIINAQLRELREQENELKTAKQENAKYQTIVEKTESTEREIGELESGIKQIQGNLQRVEDLLKRWPLIKERRMLQLQIGEIGPISFPVDGIARFERYTDRLLATSSRFNAIRERAQQIERQLKENTPNKVFLASMQQVENMISEAPQYKQLLEEMELLKRTISDYEELAMEIGREIHYPRSNWAELEHINLGMDMKGRIREVLQQTARLDIRRAELQSQLELAWNEKLSIEEKCQRLEDDMISEQEFKQLEIQFKQWQAKDQLINDKQRLEDELSSLITIRSHESEKKKQQIKQKYIGTGAFLLICISLLIWSLSSSQWMVAGFIIIVMVYAILNSRQVLDQDTTHIDKQIKNIQSHIQTIKPVSQNDALNRNIPTTYEEQLRLREEWSKLVVFLDQLQQRIKDLSNQEELLAGEHNAIQTQLYQIKSSLGIDNEFSAHRLEDAFEMLQKLADIIKLKTKTINRLKESNEKYDAWFSELKSIARDAGINETEVNSIIFNLKELIKMEQEKLINQRESVKKLKELNGEALPLEHELNKLTLAQSELLALASTDNEEDFRIKAMQFNEVSQMKERLELIETQLDGKLDAQVSIYHSEEEIIEQQKRLESEIDRLTSKLESYRSELASLRYQVKMFEEGGTYTEKLHRFHQSKSLLNEDARKWAKKALALKILQMTMNSYKQDRFPKVIQKAQDYMSFLTNGEYIRIFSQPEGHLQIERKDRLLFNPSELSQGTGEQLYTALRFALVEVLQTDYPFPVIIDDGFVNFDKDRTDKVLQLIEQISDKTQVLFFTCHEHIREYFNPVTVFELQRQNEPAGP